MKLTKKTVQHETAETVCEITQDEFEKICAETAAATVAQIVGDDVDIAGLIKCFEMTDVLAKFGVRLIKKLFTDTNEPHDKKEEK